jgi:Na+/glutamate symporter
MSEVGAQAGSVFGAAAVSLAAGGLVGGLVAVWRARRRSRSEMSTDGTSAG